MTEAVETALAGTVTEVAKISRNIGQAAYEDAQAFFAGIEKLASATSLKSQSSIATCKPSSSASRGTTALPGCRTGC